jgi:hypothetical protein
MIRCLNLKHEHIGFLNIARAGSPKNLETVQRRGLKNRHTIDVKFLISMDFFRWSSVWSILCVALRTCNVSKKTVYVDRILLVYCTVYCRAHKHDYSILYSKRSRCYYPLFLLWLHNPLSRQLALALICLVHITTQGKETLREREVRWKYQVWKLRGEGESQYRNDSKKRGIFQFIPLQYVLDDRLLLGQMLKTNLAHKLPCPQSYTYILTYSFVYQLCIIYSTWLPTIESNKYRPK